MSPQHSPMPAKDLLAVLLVIVLWGLNFVPTKFALMDLTPLQLGAARFLMISLPLILVLPRPQIPLKWLLLYALTQGFGQFGLLFFALQQGMTAALGSVLMQVQIFITALMAATLLGERLANSLLLGMAVAAAGLVCFIVSVTSNSDTSGITVVSLLLTLAAASMWSSSNIIVRQIHASGRDCKPLALIGWSSLITGTLFTLCTLSIDGVAAQASWKNVSLTGWLSLLYLSLAASGVAYWLWAVLLTRHPASRVAPFSLGIPLVGLLAGIFILDEKVTNLQWIGSALVLSALVFVVVGAQRAARRAAKRYDVEP
ncbi:EamA family transporter [Pseudomaricurvus sp. HS19]|uniref:EamA family transporter n=1 Tax=Pseudomaricurvus sp. HS19 TaxID=2692626 RepID=UPI00136C1CFF|nr:EamA family transporter [Pseudomaricurvus sp. HS19]MYM63014.1 EamA family transporter [Pseudomaricurvus sp. HS19]